MAIVTGDLYKGFTFGSVSSKAYGVYITQEAAYNSPERDVESVEIAGRNGAYMLDNGRFLNIQVSYKCGIALDNETDFESAIRVFRNALASQAGKYVRLEDEYNPDEYREAAFLGGIDVNMADRRAGEFTVSFDAKPQRFLKSGETAVSVADEGTLTNPTLYPSSPLISCEVTGEGSIQLTDERDEVIYEVDFNPAPLGYLNLVSPFTFTLNNVDSASQAKQFVSSAFVQGDTITVASGLSFKASATFGVGEAQKVTPTITGDGSPSYSSFVNHTTYGVTVMTTEPLTFTAGTSGTKSITLTAHPLPASPSVTMSVTLSIAYDGDDGITFSVSMPSITGASSRSTQVQTSNVSVDSTRSSFVGTVYLDTDIGEAYTIDGGSVASVNNFVSFGAELPTLPTGTTTVDYSNSISNVQITPRWWEV